MNTGGGNADIAGRSATILGVHLYADAYPNTKFVVDRILESAQVNAREICKPMFRRRPTFEKAKSPIHRIIVTSGGLVRAIYSHVNIFIRFWIGPKSDSVYIPYPAIGVLTVFSLLPRSWRPRRIVGDAFISIYDTAVTDRQLISATSLIGHALKALERRAYRTASVVTVDTDENQDYFADLFDLPESTFVPLPLATDEASFASTPYVADAEHCHVLFVGTFVPLQGTDVIAKAIVELREYEDISFTIVGSGQSAEEFARIVAGASPDKLTWIRDWQDSASVARHIQSADICLGVFSGRPKADRVWPFKNYAYMACGRAIVTGDTACARRMLSATNVAAFATVPSDDAPALADKIRELAAAPRLREQLAQNAYSYYLENLSNSVSSERLFRDIIFA